MLRALWRDLCYALKTQNQLAVVGATNWYPSGMAVVSIRRSGLLIVLCFFVGGDPSIFVFFDKVDAGLSKILIVTFQDRLRRLASMNVNRPGGARLNILDHQDLGIQL